MAERPSVDFLQPHNFGCGEQSRHRVGPNRDAAMRRIDALRGDGFDGGVLNDAAATRAHHPMPALP